MPSIYDYQLTQLLNQQRQRPSPGTNPWAAIGYALGGGLKKDRERQSKIDGLLKSIEEEEVKKRIEEARQEQWKRTKDMATFQQDVLEKTGGTITEGSPLSEMVGTGYHRLGHPSIPSMVLPGEQGEGYQEIPRKPAFVPYAYPTSEEKMAMDVQKTRMGEEAKTEVREKWARKKEIRAFDRFSKAMKTNSFADMPPEYLPLAKFIKESKQESKMLSSLKTILQSDIDPKDPKHRAEMFAFAVANGIKSPAEMLKLLYGKEAEEYSTKDLVNAGVTLSKYFEITPAEGKEYAEKLYKGEPVTRTLKKRPQEPAPFTLFQKMQRDYTMLEAIEEAGGIGEGLSQAELDKLNLRLSIFDHKAKTDKKVRKYDLGAKYRLLGAEPIKKTEKRETLPQKKGSILWTEIPKKDRVEDIYQTIHNEEPRKSDPLPKSVVDKIIKLSATHTEEEIDKIIIDLIAKKKLPSWTMESSPSSQKKSSAYTEEEKESWRNYYPMKE